MTFKGESDSCVNSYADFCFFQNENPVDFKISYYRFNPLRIRNLDLMIRKFLGLIKKAQVFLKIFVFIFRYSLQVVQYIYNDALTF